MRILVDANETKVSDASDATVITLAQAGAEVYLGFGRVIGSLMRNMFYVTAVKTVYMGSLNYSIQGFSDNIEAVSADPNAASAEQFRSR